MNRYPSIYLTACLLLCAGAAFAGTLTLTTYYPSPTGNYDKLFANNIGVGSLSPSTSIDIASGAVHVHDAGTVPDNGYGGLLRLTRPPASGQYINLVRAGTFPWSLGTVYNSSNFGIGQGQATDSNFTSPFFVLDTAGNAGIGQPVPAHKLHVKSTAAEDGAILDAVTNPEVRFDRSGAAKGYIGIAGAAGGYAGGSLANSLVLRSEAAMHFSTNGGATLSTIDTNGNLGVGLAAPGQKLDVSGIIRGNNEIISSAIAGSGNIRMIGGNYGAFWRNDGADFYLLFTASGDQYGGWNALRPFHVNLGSGNVAMDHNVSIGTLSVGANATITGSVTANGFFYSSDERLKTNIRPLANALDTVQKLDGVSFNWKDTGRKNIGVVAQDVEKVLPDLVATDKNGMKSVAYGNLAAVLIEAVKQQQKEIEDLRRQVGQLQKEGPDKGR